MMFASKGRSGTSDFLRTMTRFSGLALASAMMAAVGCASTGNSSAAAPSASATKTSGEEARLAAQRDVEQRYVIGPIAARQIGYRVDWQYPDAGRDIKILEAQHDSVFALDARNFLTRLNRTDGRRIWRVPVTEPVHEIAGITYIPELERVYVTSGASLLVLDAANGAQIGLQKLERIANTAPLVFGDYLIYGSRNGQVIWHSHAIAFQWRAYQISPSIQLQPVIHGDTLIAVGNDGRVAAIHARTANMHWSKRLLSAVVARPAVGQDAVYIASLDQHLWAFDLHSGREIWRHLTESELRTPPTLIGDHVYQHIPGEGLVCFEARPVDALGGRIVWKSSQAVGSVISARQGRLMLWDPQTKRITLAAVRGGAVMDQLSAGKALRLVSPNIDGSELYACSDDGRVVRLLPAN